MSKTNPKLTKKEATLRANQLILEVLDADSEAPWERVFDEYEDGAGDEIIAIADRKILAIKKRCGYKPE